MNKKIIAIAALALALGSCKKDDEYLPPDWNYDIPETAAPSNLNLGAYYTNRTDPEWSGTAADDYQAKIHDTPWLNRDGDGTPRAYVYNTSGVLRQQCEWADRAGLDFFIFDYNNSANDMNLILTYSDARAQDPACRVRMAFNYSFSHLSLNATDPDDESVANPDERKKLTDHGVSFNKIVDEFKALWAEYFSKDYYHRLQDERPLIIFPAKIASPATVDYALFMPAFRQAMADYTTQLQASDPSVSNNALNFYYIGDVADNWMPPQRNESASRWMDGSSDKLWYPSRYYERWYAFYAYTDMAWQNWRDYAAGWGNDFVPTIFPEYYVTSSGTRPIERTPENYRDFCNVAKRNAGRAGVILINSWNEYETRSALEPADRYGETYLELTRQYFNR
ncbi:MAG: hypothetical protein LBU95_00385 [Rikenellaceae bacterium]|jgi:hypothetical protein|nr:hypothetical protein [Rikenellaceae bacterium]